MRVTTKLRAIMGQASRNLKALTMRWSGSGSAIRLIPRSLYNYATAVGDGSGSAIVVACVGFVMRTFPEADLRVRRREPDGTLVPDFEHPMLQLIDDPNPFYDGLLLMQATVADINVSGNAYWIKERSGAGRPARLWWVPSPMMEPDYPKDGSTFISGYKYRPDGSKPPMTVDAKDVVHFRFGLDPVNVRKGRAPLLSVFREVFTDDEAANFTAALLRNLGVPGVVITPGADVEIDPESGETIKAVWRESFGGDRRGDVVVLSANADVKVLSFSPQQMDLRGLRRIPEERVSAVLGIPAIVAGLGAGLDRSTFANMREAREMAYESNIIPTQWLIAGALRRQLLPDYGETATWVVDFDNSNVRVLQEDQNAVETRLRGGLLAGALTVAEYRSAIGMQSSPEHDLYLRPISVLEVPAGTAPDLQTIPSREVAAPKGGAWREISPSAQLGNGSAGAPQWAIGPPEPLRGARFLSPGRKAQPSPAANARYVERLHREAAAMERRFTQDLTRAYSRLGRAVAERFREMAREGKSRKANGDDEEFSLPTPDGDIPADWPAIIAQLVQAAASIAPLLPDDLLGNFLAAEYMANYAAIGDATFAAVSDQLGIVVGFNLDDPVAQALLQQGATQAGLVDIEQQTKDAIYQALADGRANGDSIPQLTKRLQDYVEGAHMYPGIAAEKGPDAAAQYRAQVIARTETRTAQNLSSILAYQKSEVVAAVLVFDGDGCGWLGHDDPDVADGSTRTLDEAFNTPLAHPQCVRAFAPVVREGPAT